MSSVQQRDPDFLAGVLPAVRAFADYFSPRVSGVENIPESGPVLLIGNHSGLHWVPDVGITVLSMLDRRGIGERTYALGYDLLFKVPFVGDFLRRLGALPASHGAGEEALKDGGALLVYPGGDWEACRPWADRNKIDFGGRTGFVRLALRAGVPVVPVVAHGSHDTVMILSRGERTARFLGLDRLRIKVFPYTLGVPFGFALPVLPQFPLPARIHVSFLPPLQWSLEPGDPDDPAVVAACADDAVRVMQAELDRLAEECPNPLAAGIGDLLARVGV